MVEIKDVDLERESNDVIARARQAVNTYTSNGASDELERQLAEMDRKMNMLRTRMVMKLGHAAIYAEKQVKCAYDQDRSPDIGSITQNAQRLMGGNPVAMKTSNLAQKPAAKSTTTRGASNVGRWK